MYTEAMNSFVYPSSHRAKLLNIFEGLYIYHIHKNCHRFTYIYTSHWQLQALYSRQSSRPSRPPPSEMLLVLGLWDSGRRNNSCSLFLAWMHSIFLKYIWEKVITKANFNALLYVFEASALSNSTEILL